MRLWRLFLLLVSSIFMTACGPIATPPISSYTLTNLKSVSVPSKSASHLSLLVSNPIASPGYQTAAMIYMITPYELRTFADNRWVAPPAQMLLPIFVQAIRKTGYFIAVVSPPFAGVTSYHLDTQLLKLQQEFLLPNSVVRLSIQASLVSSRTSQVVASRLFEVVMVTQTNNPYGGVLAANQAAAIVSEQIAQFCMRYAR